MKFTAVTSLIALNVLAYVVQRESNGAMDIFALWPIQAVDGYMHFQLWQIITYAFLHSTESLNHLLFNMLGLWMFGTEVERYMGARRLLACYFASVVSAALCQLFVPLMLGAASGPTIGASGGVFGLVLAYAYLFPKRKVIPLIPPIPMPAWLFATLYAGVELFAGVTGTMSGVAHFAHLGGMVGSALVILRWPRIRT